MRSALTTAGRAVAGLARRARRGDGRSAPRPGAAERAAALARCRAPVLLLHGWLSTCRAMRVLERRLRRAGHAALSLELPSTRCAIDDLAARLDAEIEALHDRHPGMAPLTIVGHSQGGLVAAWYVKELRGDRRVRALVTLGTPHHGTPLALAGLPIGRLARSLPQMAPRSRLVRRLRESGWPEHVDLVSFWSRQDWVVPAASARLDTSRGPRLRNVEVPGSHFDFLTDAGIHALVLREVRSAAAAPGPPPLPAPTPLRPTPLRPTLPALAPVERLRLAT